MFIKKLSSYIRKSVRLFIFKIKYRKKFKELKEKRTYLY